MPFRAVRLSCMYDGDCITSERVYPESDNFHMAMIDARAIATEMVDGKSGRNWSDIHLIAQAMSLYETTTKPKLAIAVLIARGEPRPTGVVTTGSIDLRPKTLLDFISNVVHACLSSCKEESQ